MALIDTGASHSGVDETLITKLAIPPIDIVKVLTPAGPSTQNVYAATIRFSTAPLEPLNFARLAGCNFTGQPIVAILGRDVLQNWLLLYNGVTGEVTISF